MEFRAIQRRDLGLPRKEIVFRQSCSETRRIDKRRNELVESSSQPDGKTNFRHWWSNKGRVGSLRPKLAQVGDLSFWDLCGTGRDFQRRKMGYLCDVSRRCSVA